LVTGDGLVDGIRDQAIEVQPFVGKGGGLRDGAETETKGGVGVEGIVELEDGASVGIFFGKFVRRPGLVADGGEEVDDEDESEQLTAREDRQRNFPQGNPD